MTDKLYSLAETVQEQLGNAAGKAKEVEAIKKALAKMDEVMEKQDPGATMRTKAYDAVATLRKTVASAISGNKDVVDVPQKDIDDAMGNEPESEDED